MRRRLITTALVVSIAFVVTLLVAYARPFRNSRLTRQVDVPASSVNSSAVESPIPTNAGETGRQAGRLALQPEALKLAKRIGHSSELAQLRMTTGTGPILRLRRVAGPRQRQVILRVS